MSWISRASLSLTLSLALHFFRSHFYFIHTWFYSSHFFIDYHSQISFNNSTGFNGFGSYLHNVLFYNIIMFSNTKHKICTIICLWVSIIGYIVVINLLHLLNIIKNIVHTTKTLVILVCVLSFTSQILPRRTGFIHEPDMGCSYYRNFKNRLNATAILF